MNKKRINPIVTKIESFRDEMMSLSENSLKEKTIEYLLKLKKVISAEIIDWAEAESLIASLVENINDVIEEIADEPETILSQLYGYLEADEGHTGLILTELFLKKLGKGACRVHGGGFAGVIMCVVPKEETKNYVEYISKFAGAENVYPMNIRGTGAAHVE